MDVYRLLKSELQSELALRGINGDGTVEMLRKRLRSALLLEEAGHVFTRTEVPDRPLFHDTEVSLIDLPIGEPIPNTNSPRGPPFRHSSADDSSQHNAMTHTQEVLNGDSTREPPLMYRRPVLEESVRPSFFASPELPLFDRVRSTPVCKWNVSFDGEPLSISVSAFIEHVRELQSARHVSDRELFISASDLFRGKALIWFRANRSQFFNWKDIEIALRTTFLPPDYDFRLMNEIRDRTQGPDEPVAVFVAVMKNMFGRLTTVPSEDFMLGIIRRNLHPSYIAQLGLIPIVSLDQLVDYGRRLEETKFLVEDYRPPPHVRSVLEPDLAYERRPVRSNPRVNASFGVELAAVSQVRCWNCSQLGHVARLCREPRRLHCFRCGKAGVTTRQCCADPTRNVETNTSTRQTTPGNAHARD